ncbi:UDP-glucose/GDP-mannose dehydrogenase family protein [Paenibacillus jamilae]|uniref:UDP-glucose 6-dehydrogenase n=1 Tax=Bacillus thuringiensis serovar subtoxicus TaxID=475791 RepID=A0A9X6IK44_BACTU|nr:UDP-glucose/GDP-mannose dehydrogenase family protein [Bacillus thuringiensis]MEB4839124.1 UDP-glucose/GDP-mannose dehydrogenase family protein [Paenibacillus jamilae]MEB8581028.1 UDP-glucose/GDP-mannose dehydrogenase family protein [Bacillus cereus]MCR6855253.1 UDP-glucose/GDP-mannose dehydrogenase family protein [Bacillus thuringiensis]MDR4284587.1 UDP-glucose/GDP-mannose dehydrogenase family protein [Bacillus thuringiensis]MEB8592855.1 UDP-glucose/GDP-mannose dehydrogenase family protein 
MNIAVVGTGYVGLVTGVCLSEINHQVICIDTDEEKVRKMQSGVSPIYEPGLDELMQKNIKKGTLHFSSNHQQGFRNAEIIFIAVGTPQLPDGSANLQYVETVAKSIAKYVQKDVIVVTKSTVPVGTNDFVKKTILDNLEKDVKVRIASNPEFLREGSAIQDTFQGDRIVIGTEDEETAKILEGMYHSFGLPVFKTDIYSSEMIKYASNAFLATKISFINEISNICEKLGANVEDVAGGMGMDHRIGRAFLNAGIGYGGSCFPKDTEALVQIAGGVEHDFHLLKSVIEVNNSQQAQIVEKVKARMKNLAGKKIAMLGLAFKPNTDDMREAASIVIANKLIKEGAKVIAYDPIAMESAKKVLPQEVVYVDSLDKCLEGAEATIIVTEWEEFKSMDLNKFRSLVKNAILFDGRNCFNLKVMEEQCVEYYSVGRPVVNNKDEEVLV